MKFTKHLVILICAFCSNSFYNQEVYAIGTSQKELSILEKIENKLNDLEAKFSHLSKDVEEIKFLSSENKIGANTKSTLRNENQSNNQDSEMTFDENEFFYKNDEFEEVEDGQSSYQNIKGNDLGFEKENSIETLYRDSIEEFRVNNYERSEALLQKIIHNPGSNSEIGMEIKANAHFLMGEIFFKKPDYQKSATNFLLAHQIFSKIDKKHIQAGNSLLRLGQALYETGDKNAACKSFVKLSNDFSGIDNSLSQISESEILKLKCL